MFSRLFKSPSPCPIFIRRVIAKRPSIEVLCENISEKEIVGVKFGAEVLDATLEFVRPVREYAPKLVLKSGEKSPWLTWPWSTPTEDDPLTPYMDEYKDADLRVGVWVVKVLFSDGTSWSDDGSRMSRQFDSGRWREFGGSEQAAPPVKTKAPKSLEQQLEAHESRFIFFRVLTGIGGIGCSIWLIHHAYETHGMLGACAFVIGVIFILGKFGFSPGFAVMASLICFRYKAVDLWLPVTSYVLAAILFYADDKREDLQKQLGLKT